MYVSIWMNRLTNTKSNEHAYGWAYFRSWDNRGPHGRNKEQTLMVAYNGVNSERPELLQKNLS
jgi:hypothetical protein